ncbi:hypothetical protein Bbelb_425690 [Branchiostoma belcheri]|nr:hypothetical protein Bbelb_437110 [Branchiostoma belcheri]KAI8479713.1 hypothetical protein Bbelb_425690 [Branchiostoma belcheri]
MIFPAGKKEHSAINITASPLTRLGRLPSYLLGHLNFLRAERIPKRRGTTVVLVSILSPPGCHDVDVYGSTRPGVLSGFGGLKMSISARLGVLHRGDALLDVSKCWCRLSQHRPDYRSGSGRWKKIAVCESLLIHALLRSSALAVGLTYSYITGVGVCSALEPGWWFVSRPRRHGEKLAFSAAVQTWRQPADVEARGDLFFISSRTRPRR